MRLGAEGDPMPRALTAGAIVALLVGVAGFAEARAPARAITLPEGQRSLYVAAGVPDLELGLCLGQNSLVDLTPRLRLLYGRGTRVGGAGTAIGLLARLMIARAGDFTVSLAAEPEFSLHWGARDHPPAKGGSVTSDTTALSLGVPIVLAETGLGEQVRLLFGAGMPIQVIMSPRAVLAVSPQGRVAAEVAVNERVAALGGVELGYDLYGPGGDPRGLFLYRAWLGLSWRLLASEGPGA
jgi:hypothetical protein